MHGECSCESDQACDCGESHGSCGCHESDTFVRRYQTKAEQIADLEYYLDDLKLEVQAVEEHLADLRS